jgi:hypothetical protein
MHRLALSSPGFKFGIDHEYSPCDRSQTLAASLAEECLGFAGGHQMALFVFVWFSDDRRLAVIGRVVVVILILVIIIVIRISRRQHVAHEG